MTAAITRELAEHPELVYRHTVGEYHAMIASGGIIEGEPFELLDGQVVRRIRSAKGEDLMTVGTEHALIVMRLAKLSGAFEARGCHLRSQQPVTLSGHDEPEPDAAIVRGSLEEYGQRHPEAPDVLCVIEVSDSSLARDRGYKLGLYANAGIAMYVIVNLLDRKLEVYTSPIVGEGRYGSTAYPFVDASIAFPMSAGGPVVVPVKQILM